MPVLKRKGAQVGVSKMKLHAHELRKQIREESKRRAEQNKKATGAEKKATESKPAN